MSKEIKEYPVLIFVFLMLFVFLIYLFEFKKPEYQLTEQDYFNKFCPKHYDVSCDKIKIK